MSYIDLLRDLQLIVDCPKCEGTGIIRRANTPYSCILCDGIGTILTQEGAELIISARKEVVVAHENKIQ